MIELLAFVFAALVVQRVVVGVLLARASPGRGAQAMERRVVRSVLPPFSTAGGGPSGILLFAAAVAATYRMTIGLSLNALVDEFGVALNQAALLTGPPSFLGPVLAVAVVFSISRASWTAGRAPLVVPLLIASAMVWIVSAASSFNGVFAAHVFATLSLACFLPFAYARVSYWFRPLERAQAFALLGLASPIGSGLAILLVTTGLGDTQGTRAPFLIIGVLLAIATLLIALLVGDGDGRSDDPSTRFWGPALRNTLVAVSLHVGCVASVNSFVYSFLIRAHEISFSHVPWIMLGTQAVGTLVGGQLGKLARLDEAWLLRVPSIAAFGGALVAIPLFLVDDLGLVYMLLAAWGLASGVWVGPTHAAVQGVAAPRERAIASALVLGVAALGSTVATVLAGTIMFELDSELGEQATRMTLLGISVIGGTWAAFHFARAARRLPHELRGD